MRRYLLVDDNRAFAENVAEILRDEGAEVVVAESAAEALRRIGELRFDAMVTDMRMPQMGGAQLIHTLRGMDPGMPVVVATAYSGDEDLRNARCEGLLAILPKPLPLERLRQLLAGARRDGMVALIEDDDLLADNLQEALCAQGFATVRAASVLETGALSGLRPFAGLVDLRVPGGPDGAALAQFRRQFPQVPVLVMTGQPDVTLPPDAGRVLLKPFDTAKLLSGLHRLYAQRPEAP
ncbi:MAG: response regulator [Myxococcota bacterium]|nr:response regulator [Myxococcota bacterium]